MSDRYGLLSKSLGEAKLRQLYEVELLTDQEISARVSAELGVAPFHERAVARLRRLWKIESITSRQRRERREGRAGPSLDSLTPAGLRDLYSRMGDRAIGKLFGVEKPAILRLRQMWGIEQIAKTERAASNIELTDEQKEIVIGCMLGDGALLERGVFKLSHAYHQYEYLKRVHEILAPLSRPMIYEEKEMKGSGECRSAFGFRTEMHLWFRTMRQLFYPQGKRIFPASILETLTIRSLAYWYFDDGTLHDGDLPSFALGDISESSADEVMEIIGRRFGFNVYRSPRTQPTCQIMALRSASAGKLFEIVAPFATPDMLHKLPERYWPRSVRPLPKIQTSERLPLPRSLSDRCEVWEPTSPDPSLVEDVAKFWRDAGFPHHVARVEDLRTLSLIQLEHVLQGGVLKRRQVGQSSCQAFMPHIWDAHSDGATSPAQLFADDVELRKVVRSQLDLGHMPNAAGIRRGVRFQRLSGVYNFRPSVAKVLVDRYCPPNGIVYDPCGGWGGRMLGTLISNAHARYVACEPSTRTFRGLHEIAQWVGRYVPGADSRVALHCMPAEEFEPPAGVDLVMTSPPYWRQEHYANEDTQSSARYGSYDVWLERFWRNVIERSVRSLSPGGWLVLNVDDFTNRGVRYGLVEDTVAICKEFGLGEPDRMAYAMPSPVKQDNCEWVLAWCRRGALVEPVVNREPLEIVTELPDRPVRELVKICKECGRKYHTLRADTLYCGEACGARARRRDQRKNSPAKDHRIFTCQNSTCGEEFRVALDGGRPKLCPKCSVSAMEANDLHARSKTCEYRHCGRKFVDFSPKNGAKFCHEEHRRREKMLRRGEVESVRDFRKPDPVLDRE